LLVKLPAPVPSEVFESVTAGFWVKLQQTPLAVTADPPSVVIAPPLTAEVARTAEIVEVVSTGKTASVLQVTWFP